MSLVLFEVQIKATILFVSNSIAGVAKTRQTGLKEITIRTALVTGGIRDPTVEAKSIMARCLYKHSQVGLNFKINVC